MGLFSKFYRSIKESKRQKKELAASNRVLAQVSIQDFLNTHLHQNPKYQDPRRLNKFEYQCYSQNGEDGIIAEIFRRIGSTNKYFVEFGASTDGLENNTSFLLLQGWQGLWFEPKTKNIETIRNRYRSLMEEGRLNVKDAFITAENIEPLLTEMKVPSDLDLLSIDIDGNDYWVWKAINKFKPRVVVMEYNAMFAPNIKWVMKYKSDHIWNGSSHYGASLKSFEMLGQQKGYKLVGCDFTGVNSFFVREDCVKDLFAAPFTAENHYEPIRYFLYRKLGQPREFGPFEAV